MAHNNQYGVALARKIINEQHGPVVEAVAVQLMRHGRQNIQEIIRACDHPPPLVRQAMLVLLQHNHAAAYTVRPDPEALVIRPPFCVYQADLARTLSSLRQPRMLFHIREEMAEQGELAEHVIAVLLENGRLRLEQVVAGVAGKMGCEAAEANERVRHVFMSLVHSHYVERVPPCGLPPPDVQDHPNSAKGRGGKARAGSKEAAEQQARALRSLEDACYERERFRLPAEFILDGITGAAPGNGADGAAAEEDVKSEMELLAAAAEAAKRPAKRRKTGKGLETMIKQEDGGQQQQQQQQEEKKPAQGPKAAGAGAAGAAGSLTPSVVLWRVNFEEFNRRFRHAACVGMVAEKLDKDAGTAVAAMLTSSRTFEAKLQEERSVPLGEQEVAGTLARLVQSGVLPQVDTEVGTLLRTIAQDSLEMVSEVGSGPAGTTFAVNLQRIIDVLRLKNMEAVVRDRFGTQGLRVFRLLLIKGQLEQKQIADLSMLPVKDTRELLYNMMQAGFIATQDIPRTADRAPSRTFVTFRVDLAQASSRLGVELYAAAAKVRTRLLVEMDRHAEVLEIVEAVRRTGQLTYNITDNQKRAIERIKHISQALESSLLALDDMAALFNDY